VRRRGERTFRLILEAGDREERESTPTSLELAHEVGGRLGGFLDLDEAALTVRRAVNVLGEQVGIRGYDAKEIVERMGDGLRAARFRGHLAHETEGWVHGRILSGARIGLEVGHGGENGGQETFGIERFESDTVRGSDISRFIVEIVTSGGVDGENGEQGIFGANFVNVVEPLKVPGVGVESNSMPAAARKNQKQLVKRLRPIEFDALLRRRSEGVGEF
jgi:hypothetical protein